MLIKVIATLFLLLPFSLTTVAREERIAGVYRFYKKTSASDDPTCLRQNVVVRQYEDEILSLQKQLKTQSDNISAFEARLQSTFSAMRNGFQKLDDGWIGLFNGYQYKLLATTQDYTASKALCSSYGAEIAVYGIRDLGTRRIIKNALDLESTVFIGMTDAEIEGTWKWINGDILTAGENYWGLNEPNGGVPHDCGFMGPDLYNYDHSCASAQAALCEKEWN